MLSRCSLIADNDGLAALKSRTNRYVPKPNVGPYMSISNETGEAESARGGLPLLPLLHLNRLLFL
jgi:hypothetical protein